VPAIEVSCLLSNSPQFVHVEIFNHNSKLISKSPIPVIVLGVCY
jgi:hypothetical protein